MYIDETNIIEEFDEQLAIACLLNDNVLFLNNTEFYGKYTACLFVNCNDVFAWGAADGENITFNDGDEENNEIIELYKLHKENPRFGSVKWACIKRYMQPQKAFINKMKEDYYWDDILENLPKNPNNKHEKY